MSLKAGLHVYLRGWRMDGCAGSGGGVRTQELVALARLLLSIQIIRRLTVLHSRVDSQTDF